MGHSAIGFGFGFASDCMYEKFLRSDWLQHIALTPVIFLNKITMNPEGIVKAALLSAIFFSGKSDPFVTVKEGSEGREKFRTRTIMNTLDPVWKETALIAMPDVNGLLLLVRRILPCYGKLFVYVV